MTKNTFRVPTKQWRKWSESARAVFNRVYDFSYNNPTLMKHPHMPTQKARHWKTLAWNAAWIAADAVDDSIPKTVVDIEPKSGSNVCTHEVCSSLN